jgi:predicted small secreted protein
MVQSLCQCGCHGSGTLSATPGLRGLPANEGITVIKRASVLVPLMTAAGLTMLCACNTVEGVGRDLEQAGDAIQDEADDAQDRRRRDD